MEIKSNKTITLTLTEEEARDINLSLGNTVAKMQTLTDEDIQMPTVLVNLVNCINNEL